MCRADIQAVRSSAMMYLIPTPCSSLAPWGSWLTSWGILDSQALKITYCPVFQNPQSGHSTPRRVLSGTYNASSSTLAVPFNTIPPPEPGMTPDVELSMQDCVEVRSLRKEEVRGRGIPPVPEGVGTEVLEMVWSDGNKRYIGVEGVGGRLGWVSAIWCVNSLIEGNVADIQGHLACLQIRTASSAPAAIACLSTRSCPSDGGCSVFCGLASFPRPAETCRRTLDVSAPYSAYRSPGCG